MAAGSVTAPSIVGAVPRARCSGSGICSEKKAPPAWSSECAGIRAAVRRRRSAGRHGRSCRKLSVMEDQDPLGRVHYWVDRWAASQRANRSEIAAELGYPAATVLGEHALTNYSVAEDDSDAYHERQEAQRVGIVDAVLEDCRLLIPWVYWAVCRRHKLGTMGLERYDRAEAEGRVEPWVYRLALEELQPMLQERGLVV